jgi:hypothetical protein
MPRPMARDHRDDDRMFAADCPANQSMSRPESAFEEGYRLPRQEESTMNENYAQTASGRRQTPDKPLCWADTKKDFDASQSLFSN